MTLQKAATRVHRRDLDGLRGVAVSGVFLYHLEPKWLPGGFIGVDVFFVLSGYLITGIILSSIAKGTFSFADFYQRRIARIFPALAAMLLFVLLLSLWLYPNEDISSTGSAVAAASAGVANMKFMLQGSYFKIIPDTQPLLHTWSLGVEEQYYLVLPFLLVALKKSVTTTSTITRILWGMGIASYLTCVVTTAFYPNFSFYLMPTRAWELIFGGVLATSEADSDAKHNPDRRFDGYGIGIAGILGCMCLMTESVFFPGWLAMLPVAFTVQAIASGGIAETPRLTERIIGSNLMTWIGRLSYSLYLWHWPVFCFVDYSMLEADRVQRCIYKTVIAIVCASMSYFLLEFPIRRQLSVRGNKRLAYTVFAFGSMFVLMLGIWNWRNYYYNATIASIASGGRKISHGTDGPMVVLYGDSVGSSQATALSESVRKLSGSLYVTSSAGAEVFPPSLSFRNLCEFLKKQPEIDLIVIACAWHKYDRQPECIAEGLRILQETSDARIVLIGPAPFLPKNANRENLRNRLLERIEETKVSQDRRLEIENVLANFVSSNVTLVKLGPILLSEANQIRFFNEDGKQVFQDYLHLSSYGSALVWSKVDLVGILSQNDGNSRRVHDGAR